MAIYIEHAQNLQVLKKGDSFGTESFFTGAERNYAIRSLEFSTLLMIKRNDFTNLLQNY